MVFPELLTDVSTLGGSLYSSFTSALKERIGQRGVSGENKATTEPSRIDGSDATAKRPKGRLCAPEEEKRAYVTSLVGSLDQLWGVRVLAASLRVNGERGGERGGVTSRLDAPPPAQNSPHSPPRPHLTPSSTPLPVLTSPRLRLLSSLRRWSG